MEKTSGFVAMPAPRGKFVKRKRETKSGKKERASKAGTSSQPAPFVKESHAKSTNSHGTKQESKAAPMSCVQAVPSMLPTTAVVKTGKGHPSAIELKKPAGQKTGRLGPPSLKAAAEMCVCLVLRATISWNLFCI